MAAHNTRRGVDKVVDILNAMPAAIKGILLLLAAAGFGAGTTEAIHQGIGPTVAPVHAQPDRQQGLTMADSLGALVERRHMQQDSATSRVLAAVDALRREVCLLRLEVRGTRETETCANGRAHL